MTYEFQSHTGAFNINALDHFTAACQDRYANSQDIQVIYDDKRADVVITLVAFYMIYKVLRELN